MTGKDIGKVADILHKIRNCIPSINMIGGSCGLFLQNKTQEFHDVDVIVPNIDDIDLPYQEIPLTRDKKRLNRTKKYLIDDIKFDFIENKQSSFNYKIIDGLKVEPFDIILKERERIGTFIAKEYDEIENKFLK